MLGSCRTGCRAGLRGGTHSLRGMAHFVAQEQAELADTFDSIGPDAPTLCEGWDARMLVAHLVRRERSVLEIAARVGLPAVGPVADRWLRGYAQGHDFTALVATFRGGPPFWSAFALPPVREAVNLLEYVIHHEDARRGADPQAAPRVLGADRQAAVFGRLRSAAKLMMRSAPVPVELRWDGTHSIEVGQGPSRVVVTGEPVELALLAFGRQRAAQVDYAGDAASIAALRTASLGH